MPTSSGSHRIGRPFLQSWPDASAHSISVADGQEPKTVDATIDGVSAVPTAPVTGDVLVTATLNGDRVFDATANPLEACPHLVS